LDKLVHKTFGKRKSEMKMKEDVGDAKAATNADGAPNWFSWRGRRYAVLTILLSWLESAPWWRTRQAREWQVWRIEAADQATQNNSGDSDMGTPNSGVYDIATSDQRWFIRRVMD
jgi:hypothetical protein